MAKSVYKKVLAFKNRHPGTIAWRLEKHSAIIEKHLNPGEEVIYAFAAQKNDNPFNIITTAVVALTNRRSLTRYIKRNWKSKTSIPIKANTKKSLKDLPEFSSFLSLKTKTTLKK